MDAMETLQETLIERLRKAGENKLKEREAELYRLKEKYKAIIKSRYEKAVEEFADLLRDTDSNK
ncbi:MAG: hypothetical protein F7C07_02190 [Desulfurococcales archaeon]|nr:hypothetical protein [Desulfurococcales archaeon]